jgi:spermidine/putrescine transport system ATP-binding protein
VNRIAAGHQLPAGHQPSAVEAVGLVRRFGEVTALAGVSVSIRQGEFFSLLGPSGCGKTTLLRLIAGLDAPDAGELLLGGQDASAIPAHKRHVNTVFQSYALFPHLNVHDNVAFGLRMKRVGPAELAERVRRAMDLVEIGGLAARRPAELSGGQKQRVALARAFVNEPAVLLLDEPLGALDLKLRKQLQVELHQLQRRLGITFIYVTHDQEEALVMSDRIAVMNAGKIEQVDTAERIYEQPRTRFVAHFLGGCNLVSGQVKDVTPDCLMVQTALGDLTVDGVRERPRPAVGTQVTLALRPEKLGLAKPAADAGANQFEALIEDLVYSGAETQYRLRVRDLALTATVLNARAGHQGFGPGESIVCQAAPQALILLEE